MVLGLVKKKKDEILIDELQLKFLFNELIILYLKH